MDPLERLLDWIDVPSLSGEEGDFGDLIASELESIGLAVERQDVAPGRFNVLARADEPEVVFCTHLDTVPPFLPPSADRLAVRGRGSCDAKGPMMAMLQAARELLHEGERRIGFLLTVGEEVDGAGARHADQHPWSPRYTNVGEPTENRFVRGHKGIYKADLCAHGVPGHSALCQGPSALHELIDALGRLMGADWGEHPVLGPGTLNVGTLNGGVAGNVIAGAAEAQLVLRTVEPAQAVAERFQALLGEHVELTDSKGYGPVEFHVPDWGQDDAVVVAFGTDAPFLSRWGTPLLYGPGRIADAHTDHEHMERQSFERAIGDYARTARELCARA